MCSDNDILCLLMLDTADIIATVVDTVDGESDDDVSDELPVVTYACLAFQTLYFYIQMEGVILKFPLSYFHAWMINL